MKVKIPHSVYTELLKELDCVVTVPEICRRWRKSRKAVLNQIYTFGLVSTQLGKVHLVHIDSVIMLWGDPLED